MTVTVMMARVVLVTTVVRAVTVRVPVGKVAAAKLRRGAHFVAGVGGSPRVKCDDGEAELE